MQFEFVFLCYSFEKLIECVLYRRIMGVGQIEDWSKIISHEIKMLTKNIF